MSTLTQIEANRLNAQKSTGPRTPAGKAVASLNHLRHGLRARTIVLPGESAEEFELLCSRLDERYRPQGIDEEHLLEQMAVSWWKLGRVARMEQALFTSNREEDEHPEARLTLKDLLQLEARYERSYFRCEKELLKRQQARGADQPQPQPQPEPEPALPHDSEPPVQLGDPVIAPAGPRAVLAGG